MEVSLIPGEIIQTIFLYLDADDLENINLTCKEFNYLLTERFLFKYCDSRYSPSSYNINGWVSYKNKSYHSALTTLKFVKVMNNLRLINVICYSECSNYSHKMVSHPISPLMTLKNLTDEIIEFYKNTTHHRKLESTANDEDRLFFSFYFEFNGDSTQLVINYDEYGKLLKNGISIYHGIYCLGLSDKILNSSVIFNTFSKGDNSIIKYITNSCYTSAGRKRLKTFETKLLGILKPNDSVINSINLCITSNLEDLI